jgi:hypothetical protein
MNEKKIKENARWNGGFLKSAERITFLEKSIEFDGVTKALEQITQRSGTRRNY